MEIKCDSIDSFIDDSPDRLYVWQKSAKTHHIGILFDKERIPHLPTREIETFTARVEQTISSHSHDIKMTKEEIKRFLNNDMLGGIILFNVDTFHYFKKTDSSFFYTYTDGKWRLNDHSCEFSSANLPVSYLLSNNAIPGIDAVLGDETDVIKIKDRLLDTDNIFPCIILNFPQLKGKSPGKVPVVEGVEDKTKIIMEPGNLDIIIDAPIERNGVSGDFKGFCWFGEDFWIAYLGDTIGRVRNPGRTKKIINTIVDNTLTEYDITPGTHKAFKAHELKEVISLIFSRSHEALIHEYYTNETQESTFSIVIYHRGYIYFDFVGNSPIIIWDSEKNKLNIYAETKNHKGIIDNPGLFDSLEMKNRLDSPMRLGNPETKININPFSRPVKEKDFILICSDGLLDIINPYRLDIRGFQQVEILKECIHNAIFDTRTRSQEKVLDDDVMAIGKSIVKTSQSHLEKLEEHIKERFEQSEDGLRQSEGRLKNSIEKNKNDLLANFNKLKEDFKSLQSGLGKVNEAITAGLNRQDGQIVDFEEQLQGIQDTIKEIEKQSEKEAGALKEKIGATHEKISNLESQFNFIKIKYEGMISSNKRLVEVDDKISHLSKTISEITQTMSAIKKDTQDLIKRTASHQEDIDDFKDKVVLKSDYKKQLDKFDSENRRREDEISQLKKEQKTEIPAKLKEYSKSTQIEKSFCSKKDFTNAIKEVKGELKKQNKFLIQIIEEKISLQEREKYRKRFAKESFWRKTVKFFNNINREYLKQMFTKLVERFPFLGKGKFLVFGIIVLIAAAIIVISIVMSG